MDFVSQSQTQVLKQSPEYIALHAQIETAQKEIKQIKDRNQKSVAQTKLKALEMQIETMVSSVTKVPGLEQWLIDGIKQWIDTFMPNRINFRIYPFDYMPSFQVLCNLKRDCFVDQNLEHLLYGYGNRPNVSLTVFGLITSLPPKEKDAFNLMADIDDENSPEAAFEKAFREMFDAMETFESFVRFSRYPNITIHPIAVFRDFSRVKDSKENS